MDSQMLTLPVQHFTMEWTLYPNEHRIAFKTVESQEHVEGQYKLDASPDGNRTRITYTKVSKNDVTFPQSVIDSAEREMFVNTVRGIQKSATAPNSVSECVTENLSLHGKERDAAVEKCIVRNGIKD